MRLLKILLVTSAAILVLLTTCGAPRLARFSGWQPTTTAMQVQFAPTGSTPAAQPIADLPTPPPSDLARTIDEYVSSLVAQRIFSGSILVVRNGQIVFSKGYGMADQAQRIANTPQTRFRLASITKQFTAMGIMILQARGKLNVQDSICSYFPDCPPAWQPVTIRQLLSHTSGIPNYTDFADFAAIETQPTTPAELVKRFRDLPLNFEPGTAFSYGNSGYVLLGQIIERVSGQTYENFLRDAIFTPLQMNNTGYDHGSLGTVQRAVGYINADTPALPIDTSTLYSAGALYSTTEDLYRWDQALYSDILLPANLRTEMFTPVQRDYAYGWFVRDQNGRRVITHAGLMSGAASFIERLPDQQLTVIVLSNLESTNVEAISDYLATLALQ